MSLRSPTTFICLSLLGDSLLADARENDLRSATSYPCSSPGLMSSNGRWISRLPHRFKPRRRIHVPGVGSSFLQRESELIFTYGGQTEQTPRERVGSVLRAHTQLDRKSVV